MKKILITLFLLAPLAGCNLWQGMTVVEDVKPWQRGILAQEAMQLPHDSMHAYTDDHVYFSKEASTGGNGVGGGGCGCN